MCERVCEGKRQERREKREERGEKREYRLENFSPPFSYLYAKAVLEDVNESSTGAMDVFEYDFSRLFEV